MNQREIKRGPKAVGASRRGRRSSPPAGAPTEGRPYNEMAGARMFSAPIAWLSALCVLILGSFGPSLAQEAASQKRFEPALLRPLFAAAVGKDFEIVKDEFKQRSNARGGGSYWLVHIKPKRSGYFKFIHRYNYNDPHYSQVEREFNLNVGPRGCRRGPPSTGSYSKFCVGDTIIVPVVINNFTEHQFSLKSQEYKGESDAASNLVYRAASEGPPGAKINNPVADYLRYVDSSSHTMLHRSGGYTLEVEATFEALRPGRFNLEVSAAFKDKVDMSSVAAGAGGTPIIIVSRDTALTLLASRHEVRGYSRGYDGREWVSSNSSDAFMTELIILQPGDRISLKYFSRVRSADYERRELSDSMGDSMGDSKGDSKGASKGNESTEVVPPPLIIKRPFALQTEYNFTEWLVDYLPR